MRLISSVRCPPDLVSAPVRVSLFCTHLHPRPIKIHERCQGRRHAVRSTQPSVERMRRTGTWLSTLAVQKVFALQAAGSGTETRSGREHRPMQTSTASASLFWMACDRVVHGQVAADQLYGDDSIPFSTAIMSTAQGHTSARAPMYALARYALTALPDQGGVQPRSSPWVVQHPPARSMLTSACSQRWSADMRCRTPRLGPKRAIGWRYSVVETALGAHHAWSATYQI
jgi:hypothetical protein